MTQTISGIHTTVQTLSVAQPDVDVTGTINAYGVVGTYTVTFGTNPMSETFDAALFGPSSGHFTITNTGLIETHVLNTSNLLASGIMLGATGTVFNAGTVLGATGIAIAGSTGASYVENSRVIDGSLGIGIALLGGAGTVVNTGTITGEREGASMQGGGRLTNALGGVITGIASYGVDTAKAVASTVLNAGTISGYYGAVNLEDGGFVSNSGYFHATGTGSTYFYGGILSNNDGTVFNSGVVAGQNGIQLSANGSGSSSISIAGYVKNSGTIKALSTLGLTHGNSYTNNGFGIGIGLTEPGTVVNSGTITASNAGFFTSANTQSTAAALQNTSTGRINSGIYGVYMQSGGGLSNAGQISAGVVGVVLADGGSITNAAGGRIAGEDGIWNKPMGGSALYVNNSGAIYGSIFGVISTVSTTIINDGSIDGSLTTLLTVSGATYGGVGIDLFGSGAVTNAQGGVITGGQVGMVFASNGVDDGSIANSGLIAGSKTSFTYSSTHHDSSAGLVMLNGGQLSNASTGTISGNQSGLVLVGTAGAAPLIDNAGLILGAATTASYFGTGGGTVVTTYASTGLSMLNGGTVNNAAGGTIAAYQLGFLAVYTAGARLSLDNTGLIEATGQSIDSNGTVNGATGAVLNASGVVTNAASGTITGFGGGLVAAGGGGASIFIDNAGLIAATGSTIVTGGTVDDTTGVVMVEAGTLVNAASGRISGNIGAVLGPDVTFINAGTISAGSSGLAAYLQGAGDRVVDDAGAVFNGFVYDAAGNGTVELADSGSAGVFNAGGFGGFNNITIDTGGSWLLQGSLSALGGAAGPEIIGFTFGDTFILDGFTASSDSFSAGTLMLSNGSAATQLNLIGLYGGDTFALSTVAAGTEIVLEVTCYAAGTRIATALGEVAVEALQIGMEVKTLHAGLQKIKWIGMRSYAAPFANHEKVLPVRIAAGALEDGVPGRDLYVSPGHAICIDGALIHAALLVNGVSITQLPRVEQITYYHIELENHEVIFAENCPAESFVGEEFRWQFHNADSYRALYPQGCAPEHLCLAVLGGGFQLHAIRQRLAARAGIAAPPAGTGALHGYVDQAGPDVCAGWAQDMDDPETPVCLDVLRDGKCVARVLANEYREDLRAAGLGSGRHGFTAQLPAGTAGSVEIRRSADQALLPLTETARLHAA